MSEARANAFGVIGFGFVQALILFFILGVWSGAAGHGIRAMESKHFPVTTPAEVYNVRPASGGSMVSATAVKLRGCDWSRTEFRFGPRDGRSVPMLNAKHLDPPKVNLKGDVMIWDNIFLNVTPDQVANTHWNAYHYCYPALGWVTKTEMFN